MQSMNHISLKKGGPRIALYPDPLGTKMNDMMGKLSHRSLYIIT